MTAEERLIKIAGAELEVFGKVISPEAKKVYEARSAKSAVGDATKPAEAVKPRTAEAQKNTPSPANGALTHENSPGTASTVVVPAVPRLAGYKARHATQVGPPEQVPTAAQPPSWSELRAQRAAKLVERERRRVEAGRRAGITPAPSRLGISRTAQQGVPGRTGVSGSDAGEAESRREMAGAEPLAGLHDVFGGDGLFVVGLDITPGVYRTAGPGSGRRHGYFFLLRSTSTRDIAESSVVKGPVTITVGSGVKAVKVSSCQPWYRLGDTLDAVIAAAGKRGGTASSD